MREVTFVDPQSANLNSYEMCKIAMLFVKETEIADGSAAEVYYVGGILDAGDANLFFSHYQAEVMTRIIQAPYISLTSKSEHVQTLIKKVGKAVMKAVPWEAPEPLSRICHVHKVFDTVVAKAQLQVAVIDLNMQKHAED